VPQPVNRSPGAYPLIIAVMLAVLVTGAVMAEDGHFSDSPHGSRTDGVQREAALPRGSCVNCHVSHQLNSAEDYGLFMQSSNQLCFSASAGGCHADQPSGGTAGYPARETDRMPTGSAQPGYFEYNLGGIRVPGVVNRVRWPGRVIWENPTFSSHFADPDMPVRDVLGDGSCDNCHSVHGSANPFDMLDTTYTSIVGSELSSRPDNYALCLSCHSIDSPINMDPEAQSIAYFYDRGINPSSRSGHGIDDGGGHLASGQRLPCYDCHNPHGSVGYGSQGANGFLISDERPGWYGLTDIRNDVAQVRRFCFGCHPSSDLMAQASPVEGVSLSPLPDEVPEHAAGAVVHCYDCHGRDYSTPTSNNVHNPSSGED